MLPGVLSCAAHTHAHTSAHARTHTYTHRAQTRYTPRSVDRVELGEPFLVDDAAEAAARFIDLPLVWLDADLGHLEAVLAEAIAEQARLGTGV